MFDLALMSSFIREILVSERFPREPEPDLVMDDPQQVEAYVQAGRIDGALGALYLFNSSRISQVIRGSKLVLDLGCGPATQLAQVAQFNPETNFIGVDLSSKMLEDAERHVHREGLKNVTFRQGDITDLQSFSTQQFDGVISTMALHHLPSFGHLERCFSEIRRVLKQDGALYLVDFGRLKSLKSVISLAYLNAKHKPRLFMLDYERSLRAAFLKEEFDKLADAHFSGVAKVVSTFGVPFLLIVKTPDRGIDPSLRQKVQGLSRELKPRYRRDLNDIRTFFSLGGLRDDPFS